MTREEIVETLSLPTSETYPESATLELSGPAFDTFVIEMKDKQYGYEALSSAWNWFFSGWDARARFDGYH